MSRNTVLLCVSCGILAIALAYDVNYLNYKAPMPYSEWKNITWDDFKGHKRPYDNLNGEDQFAFIVTNIVVDHMNDGTSSVTAFFHPSRSYVYSQNTVDKALLRHELYHFHITETVARMIRRELLINQKSVDISKFKAKEDSLQRAYDEDTYHGYKLSKQKMWQTTIDSSLASLEKFSNPVVTSN